MQQLEKFIACPVFSRPQRNILRFSIRLIAICWCWKTINISLLQVKKKSKLIRKKYLKCDKKSCFYQICVKLRFNVLCITSVSSNEISAKWKKKIYLQNIKRLCMEKIDHQCAVTSVLWTEPNWYYARRTTWPKPIEAWKKKNDLKLRENVKDIQTSKNHMSRTMHQNIAKVGMITPDGTVFKKYKISAKSQKQNLTEKK